MQDSKKWLIVLDLDDTIIHTVQTIRGINVALRPYVREFVSAFSSKCEFAIWSKGNKSYVRKVTSFFNKFRIDGEIIPFEVDWFFIWGLEDCVEGEKILSKISTVYPIYNRSNTIFIDDSVLNFKYNQDWYCIPVPKFIGYDYDTTFLRLLLEVHEFTSNLNLTEMS